MLNAAMIGLGWWGKHSIDSVHGKSDKIGIVAASSRDTSQHADYLHARNIAAKASYEDILADPSIDAVVLTTPHSQHHRQILDAAAVGKHVFVEKPVTLTRADAVEAVDAMKAAGLTLGSGFSRRFQPSFNALVDTVRSGAVGEVLHIEGEQSGPSAYRLNKGVWRATRAESPGGAMAARGVHVLDGMIHIAGPVSSISAISDRRVVDLEVDDTSAMMMRFAGGASGYLGSIYVTADIWRLQVYGSKGYAMMRGETSLVAKDLANVEKITNFAPVNIVGLALEAFADAATGGAPYPVTPDEVVAGVAAYEAMVKSAEQNSAWINV
jgi:predicted dehydrogenase